MLIHTRRRKLQKIEEVESIELLPHPAFSPDLEPSDYYLFRPMAQYLRGKKFQSVADMEAAVEEFFASRDKEWLYGAFKEFVENWVKTTEHESLYSEHRIIFILYVLANKSFNFESDIIYGTPSVLRRVNQNNKHNVLYSTLTYYRCTFMEISSLQTVYVII
jgi:hypothetical protein